MIKDFIITKCGMGNDLMPMGEDVVKEVHLTVSPTEYLIISAALKQFVENPANHSVDIEVAKQMRTIIEKDKAESEEV